MRKRTLALLLFAGCTPTTFTFTPMVKGVVAKPDNCSFETLTTTPQRDYQEIGTLDLYNGNPPKTLDAFHKAVAKDVCSGGGDAVIAFADPSGQFTKGSVIVWTGHGDTPVRAGTPPAQQTDNELPK